jgi:CRP-like cAMP-binding protein
MTNLALKNFILSIYPLSSEILDEVSSYFKYQEYPKYTILQRQGKPCRYLWLLTKGVVRHYYTDDEGKESNVWFSFDRDIVTVTQSFSTQNSSSESIQLLEDSELFAIEYNDIYNLLQKHHSFALWQLTLIERFYITQIEDRITELQFLNAKQRYEKLLVQFPDISNRINLGHISSYLNITQETLSRIRSGKI